MASFFGEVLPVISRAVEDEESDDEFINPEFIWKPSDDSGSKQFSPNWLVMAVGAVPAGFLQCHMELTNSLGNIVEINDSKEKTIIGFYSSTCGKVIYCISSTYILPDKLWCLVQKVFEVVHCGENTRVCLLDADTVYNYHTHSIAKLSLPFLRHLKTSKHPDVPDIDALSQPNMAKGLTAAVMSYCQLNKIAAALYICYTETVLPDAATLLAFSKLTGEEPFKTSKVPKEESLSRIKLYLQSPANNQTLYI
uniref:Proteasome assembly chaperone 1 n=1 Tax=Phallusia mammillata TaxID=59560 RepID=A0A6F9DP77_9ASCI|nr:proteasome assembly chaperone 1-like [Phallusia mammillata]